MNTSVWTVTRQFHFDGQDMIRSETKGVFSSEEAATQFALVEDCMYKIIASPCEIEEVTVYTEVPQLDDEDQETLADSLTEEGIEVGPDLAAALDQIWPDWRGRTGA